MLKKDGSQVVLTCDSDALRTNMSKSFFIHDMNFCFDPSANVYVYEGPTSADFIESVVEFLKMCDIPYELDSECQKLLNQNETSREQFVELQRKGSLIKKSAPQEIDIPFMNKTKKLKSYQLMPVIHASTVGSVANFSVPGSGKTWMAYASFFILKSKGEIEKLLVVGPISSFRPWETEYFEMTGRKARSVRISGKPERRRSITSDPEFYEIFLISYQTAQIEFEALKSMLLKHKFMMVIDESHHIKNPFGEWSNALIKLAPFAHRRMILSGTPLPNKLDDLWSQFTFLYPHQDVLGDYTTFKYDITQENALENISALLNPFYTRVSKNTLKLPPAKFFRMRVQMSPIQRKIYDAIRGFVRKNDAAYRQDAVAMQQFRNNSIIYLLEAGTDPSLLTKSSQYHEKTIESEGLAIQELLQNYEKFEVPQKIDVTRKLVEKSMLDGEKIIVWCSFVPTIKKLSQMFRKYSPISIWGAIPKDDEEDPEFNREIEIEKFKSNSNANLLIANPASLAESISLHKVCHHAIYLDRTFNGGHYMQSLERIHRIGMESNVKTRYTILMSAASLDEVIDERLEEKKERMLRFLNDKDFAKLSLDLDYENAFGGDDEFVEDYKRVYEHVMKD